MAEDRKTLALGYLREAKLLLKDGWCQGAEARNQFKESVNCESKDAISFCLIGAVNRAFSNSSIGDSESLFLAFRFLKRVTHNSLIHFNDQAGMTLSDILQAVDAAIELGKKPDGL